MTAFDLTIIIILAVSMLIGIYRGFIRESFSLVMLALALVIAVKFSALPQVWLPDIELSGYLVSGDDLQLALVFSLLFIMVLIIGRFANRIISDAVRRSFMNLIDRFLGAVFGLVRGGAVVLILVLFSGLTSVSFSDAWRASVMISPFEHSARYAMCYVPQAYKISHYACETAEI